MSTFTTPPNNSQFSFSDADSDTQLEMLFSLLSVKEDHVDYTLVREMKNRLDQLTRSSVRFIIITSGENAGEKRQIYKDGKGQPFFWQGKVFFFVHLNIFIIFFFIKGKKCPKKQYLTEWYDDRGFRRSPNASIRALQQYAQLMADAEPQQLFLEDV